MNNTEEAYLDLVKKAVFKHIPKNKYNIFLFGSRARKKHRFAADIDIGIQGKEPIDQNLIYKIKDEIEESVVPFNVDIIDFNNVSNEFKEEALKNIKIWNQISPIN